MLCDIIYNVKVDLSFGFQSDANKGFGLLNQAFKLLEDFKL